MNGDWVNRRTITLSGLDKKFRTSEAGGSPGERGSISGPDRKIGTCTGNGLTQTGTSSRFRFFGGVVDPTWLDFGSRLVDLGSCRVQIYSRVSASHRNGDQMYCRVSVTHRFLTGTPIFPGPNVFQGASYSPERGPSLFQVRPMPSELPLGLNFPPSHSSTASQALSAARQRSKVPC